MKRSFISFTLVEMIVALAVLSILTFILFSVLNETSRAISLSSGRTSVYNNSRMAMDQLGRELQQAVSDNRYDCFIGDTNVIHFVATIDNTSGDEEAVVGYFFPTSNGSNLSKTLQFMTINSTNNFTNWKIGEARTNSATPWEDSPPTSSYTPILDNVKSIKFQYANSTGPFINTWDYQANGNRLPVYIQISVGVCDPQDVIRYRGISGVPAPLTRYFTNTVYLPRQ